MRVLGLAKSISDHTPLLVDTVGDCVGMKKKFRFEKWWLEREDIKKIVDKACKTSSGVLVSLILDRLRLGPLEDWLGAGLLILLLKSIDINKLSLLSIIA